MDARSIASDGDQKMLTRIAARGNRRNDRHDADRDGDNADTGLQAAVGPGQPPRGDRERYRNHGRQRAHPDHRADAEQRDVAERDRGTGGLRYRKHQQRRRPCHAMHQSHQQRAPAKTVGMGMAGTGMRHGFAGMAVRMDMDGAVVMTVLVKMHALAPQLPQHMAAETDEHDADGGLQRPSECFRDGAPEPNCGAGNGEQCQGMAKAPGQPVLDDVGHLAAACGDAGHRGDMIGLERMLHAEQKSQPQNSEHLPCQLLTSSHIHASTPLGRRSHCGAPVGMEPELRIGLTAGTSSIGTSGISGGGRWRSAWFSPHHICLNRLENRNVRSGLRLASCPITEKRMTKLKLFGAAASILSSALATPLMAQEVIYNPGYCAQFYPDANCQNKGWGNPYTGSYQRRVVGRTYWDS